MNGEFELIAEQCCATIASATSLARSNSDPVFASEHSHYRLCARSLALSVLCSVPPYPHKAFGLMGGPWGSPWCVRSRQFINKKATQIMDSFLFGADRQI